MMRHGKWAQCGEKWFCWLSVTGQFCPLDVRVAGCCCPLHETAEFLVTVACGCWHDWLWRPYRSPAWEAGLWPEIWHQNVWAGNKTAPLALASLFFGGLRGGLCHGGELSGYSTVHMTASWRCSLLTTQMESDESGGFLWVLVVTNPRRRPRPSGGKRLLSWDIRPADWVSGELHVTDQRLDGCLSYQACEKKLGDEAGRDGAQGGKAQQQAAEALRLTRVLHPLVLCQSHLSLLLQRLHVNWVC